jgi:hypothetical protein
METTTPQPCPACDGKGYTEQEDASASRQRNLRCEQCLESGKVIAADHVMACRLNEYPGCVYYFGNQWGLFFDRGGLTGSHACNFVAAFHDAIRNGYTYSRSELAWAHEVQDEIDKVVTQGLGEPVFTLPKRVLKHARKWGWPVKASA